VAAIIMFLVKEVVEAVRRHLGDKRKIHGLKTLFARECELNLWTIMALRSILVNVPKPDDSTPQTIVRIEHTEDKAHYALIISNDGASKATRPIPIVHRELMTKYLLDTATLNKELFGDLEVAYDALADLSHVRQSLIQVHEDQAQMNIPEFFCSFAEWALDELDEIESALALLYKHCTGGMLENHRLR
jgi:hypothetical protein